MNWKDDEIIIEMFKDEGNSSPFNKHLDEEQIEINKRDNEATRKRIFKRFEGFVNGVNSDIGDLEDIVCGQFKHSYTENPISSLTHEFWEHRFAEPDYSEGYTHERIGLKIVHEGLSYDEISERILSGKEYGILASFRGYYTLMGHGFFAYIDTAKYSDIFCNLIERHDSLGGLVYDFLFNFLDYHNPDAKYDNLKEKLMETGKLFEYDYPKLKEGMFPAPKWLVYPQLTFDTMGWRMGAGEDYSMNFHSHRIDYQSFSQLFEQPLNWNMKYSEIYDDYVRGKYSYEGNLAPFSIAWSEKGKPKYPFREIAKDKNLDELDEDEFIFLDEIFDESIFDQEFAVNGQRYKSIGAAASKMKRHFLHDDDIHLKERIWEEIKYSVVLNFLYFRIMPHEGLVQKLIDSGDRIILCDSNLVDNDDYFWCINDDEEKFTGANRLGSAFMELRDEINRLYRNNDRIDWFYSEFLKDANSYTFKPYGNEEKDNEAKVDFNNPQSPEYLIYKATYNDSKLYVRDIDLRDELEGKYEIGAMIMERGFVDMTDRIGKMSTSHRYAIFSNHVGDLSEFEDGTDWSLHTAAAQSKFKVLDIYKYNGKTQILLLHLMDGFEEIFKDNNTIDEAYVERARKVFEESFEKEIIPEVNSPEWLKRCSFPLGMDDKENLWDLDG